MLLLNLPKSVLIHLHKIHVLLHTPTHTHTHTHRPHTLDTLDTGDVEGLINDTVSEKEGSSSDSDSGSSSSEADEPEEGNKIKRKRRMYVVMCNVPYCLHHSLQPLQTCLNQLSHCKPLDMTRNLRAFSQLSFTTLSLSLSLMLHNRGLYWYCLTLCHACSTG